MFSASRFSQLLKFIPRPAFSAAVQRSQADRYAKKVGSWDLLVTLLFGQLTQAKSLRSLAVTSQALQADHYHLNAKPLSRLTLCDALQGVHPSRLKSFASCSLLKPHASRGERWRR